MRQFQKDSDRTPILGKALRAEAIGHTIRAASPVSHQPPSLGTLVDQPARTTAAQFLREALRFGIGEASRRRHSPRPQRRDPGTG